MSSVHSVSGAPTATVSFDVDAKKFDAAKAQSAGEVVAARREDLKNRATRRIDALADNVQADINRGQAKISKAIQDGMPATTAGAMGGITLNVVV